MVIYIIDKSSKWVAQYSQNLVSKRILSDQNVSTFSAFLWREGSNFQILLVCFVEKVNCLNQNASFCDTEGP